MIARVNHLAAIAAAIAYTVWGWIYHALTVGKLYEVPAFPDNSVVLTLVLGLIITYTTAFLLARFSEDWTAWQGVLFALFLGMTEMTLWYQSKGLPNSTWGVIGTIAAFSILIAAQLTRSAVWNVIALGLLALGVLLELQSDLFESWVINVIGAVIGSVVVGVIVGAWKRESE